MKSLQKELRKRLGDSSRVAVIGIGSQFRGDDSAGLVVAEALKKFSSRPAKYRVFIGSTAPENLTGAVRRFSPDHVILVDAADFKKRAGFVRVVDPREAHGTCFCTHQLPLQIMAEYLTRTMEAGVTIIGIQAKTLDFGSPLNPAVKKAALDLAAGLKTVLK